MSMFRFYDCSGIEVYDDVARSATTELRNILYYSDSVDSTHYSKYAFIDNLSGCLEYSCIDRLGYVNFKKMIYINCIDIGLEYVAILTEDPFLSDSAVIDVLLIDVTASSLESMLRDIMRAVMRGD